MTLTLFPESPYDYSSIRNNEDSGFDLFCPDDVVVPRGAVSFKIDLKVKAVLENRDGQRLGYMLVPRSSTGSRSPIRLSNSIGIIDSGYNGNLMAFVDNVDRVTDFSIHKGDRLFQLVQFSGIPFDEVNIETKLSPSSSLRGDGGFGSTGT